MKHLFTFLSLFLFVLVGYGQTTIWTEDFTNDDGIGAVGPIPTITAPISGKWSVNVDNCDLSASDDWFKVTGGVLEARDVGGTQQSNGTGDGAIWTSQSISITGYASVTISVDVSESGDIEHQDFVKASYKIDGGSITQFGHKYDDFTAQSLTVNGLSGSTLTIYLEADNNAAIEYLMFDNIVVTGVATPTIGISPAILNDFVYTLGSGPSADQSFTAEGTNLTNDISITPSTNFEISLSSGISFSATSSITLTQSGGSVSSTTIYTRLKAGLVVNSHIENVTASSTGATSKTVTCSGKVIKQEPSNHVSGFAITTAATTDSEITISWSDNDGSHTADKYLIKASSTSYNNIIDPTDGVEEPNSALVENISHGTETVTFTGLVESTTYYFQIYPYANSDNNTNYKIGSEPQVSETTKVTPIAPVIGDLVITEIVGDDVDGTNDDDGYVEVYNNSSNPIDLTDVSIRYYNENPNNPTTTFALSGSIDSEDYIVIAQDGTAFQSQYGQAADFVAGGTFYFNGDDDGIDVYYSGSKADVILDAFNDNGIGATPWTWDDANVFERKSTGTDGAVSSNWNENTTETGTPGAESNDTPLPISLVSFSGEKTELSILLSWQTATEENNDHFTLERSYNAQDFTPIAKIVGAGNSNNIEDYSFIDNTANLQSTIYYKLKQTDFDGNYTFSEIISVNSTSSSLSLLKTYFVDGNLHLQINSSLNVDIRFEIYDVSGRMLSNDNINLIQGMYNYRQRINQLSNGIYFFRLIDSANGSVIQDKFMVM